MNVNLWDFIQFLSVCNYVRDEPTVECKGNTMKVCMMGYEECTGVDLTLKCDESFGKTTLMKFHTGGVTAVIRGWGRGDIEFNEDSKTLVLEKTGDLHRRFQVPLYQTGTKDTCLERPAINEMPYHFTISSKEYRKWLSQFQGFAEVILLELDQESIKIKSSSGNLLLEKRLKKHEKNDKKRGFFDKLPQKTVFLKVKTRFLTDFLDLFTIDFPLLVMFDSGKPIRLSGECGNLSIKYWIAPIV